MLAPLVRRERSDLSLGGGRGERAHTGVGDVAILGYLRLLPTVSRTEWTLGGGVKLATGSARTDDDTGELPEELQPGTGANDVLLTSTASHALSSAFTASIGATWRGTGTHVKIDDFFEADGTRRSLERRYAFGDELLYGAGAAWSPNGRLGLGLGVRGRHAEPDRGSQLRPDGSVGEPIDLPSTGGEWLWLAPTARWAMPQGLALTAGVLVPLWQNPRGTQLSSRTGLRVSLESVF